MSVQMFKFHPFQVKIIQDSPSFVVVEAVVEASDFISFISWLHVLINNLLLVVIVLINNVPISSWVLICLVCLVDFYLFSSNFWDLH